MIKEKLIKESRALINGNFLKQTRRLMKVRQPFTLDHSERVGAVFGPMCEEFYNLPSFVGEVCGRVHDAGKLERRIEPLILRNGLLSAEEMELVREHVLYSWKLLHDEFPNIAQVVRHHHSSCQINPYPGPQEQDLYFLELQVGLGMVDKLVARTEFRPELTEKQRIERRTAGIEERAIDYLRQQFLDVPMVEECIDYLGGVVTRLIH